MTTRTATWLGTAFVLAFAALILLLPRAIHLIAELLRTHDPRNLPALLHGFLYDVQREIHLPSRKLISSVRPRLVNATEQLVQRLKARPGEIHQIGHRTFEELVAELLSKFGSIAARPHSGPGFPREVAMTGDCHMSHVLGTVLIVDDEPSIQKLLRLG
jgi:hypothetical protein